MMVKMMTSTTTLVVAVLTQEASRTPATSSSVTPSTTPPATRSIGSGWPPTPVAWMMAASGAWPMRVQKYLQVGHTGCVCVGWGGGEGRREVGSLWDVLGQVGEGTRGRGDMMQQMAGGPGGSDMQTEHTHAFDGR